MVGHVQCGILYSGVANHICTQRIGRSMTLPRVLQTNPRLDCILIKVVDNNGIHQVWFRTCSCREEGEEYDFLELGMYPASYTWVDTVFTFDLLQNCRFDNLECKTSVYYLWARLKQLTCLFFPSGLPVSNVES